MEEFKWGGIIKRLVLSSLTAFLVVSTLIVFLSQTTAGQDRGGDGVFDQVGSWFVQLHNHVDLHMPQDTLNRPVLLLAFMLIPTFMVAGRFFSFRGIQELHEARLCHGDIRNDHILIDEDTGAFRWIDFDMSQDYSDFDIWSVGNILQVVVGKGLMTYQRAVKEEPKLAETLSRGDASVFFPHRIMNLRKIFPHVPEGLNTVLMRFSQSTELFYESITQIIEDLGACDAAYVSPMTGPGEDPRSAG